MYVPLAAVVRSVNSCAVTVQQLSAELVAERVPHDRVHAYQPRRKMADREELHELHVDQRGTGAQRQRISVAAHIGGGAVAPIEPGQAAGSDHDGLGLERDDRRSGYEVPSRRGFAIATNDIDDDQVADPADSVASG